MMLSGVQSGQCCYCYYFHPLGHDVEQIYGCRSLETEIECLRLLAILEGNVEKLQPSLDVTESFSIWDTSERLVHDIASKFGFFFCIASTSLQIASWG